jgi:TolB-like protein
MKILSLLLSRLSAIKKNMPDNRVVPPRAIIGLLLTLFLTSAVGCALLPGKKSPSPYTKAQLAKLADKDIYVIDGEKYVKVATGKDDKGNVRYAYVKVDRYLAGEVEPVSLEQEQIKKEEEVKGVEQEPEVGATAAQVRELERRETHKTHTARTKLLKYPYLKRKIAVLPFEDRTTFTFEKFGEAIADRLAENMETKVFTCLVMDRETVRLTLAKSGLTPADLKDPAKTKVLNKALGVQGVIVGTVYGPFVSTTAPATKEEEKVSMAVVRIEANFIDAAEGRIVKKFVATNPAAGSEEFGSLCEERAKYRAIDIVVDQIMAQAVDEINGMDWLTRIALVEGNTVYLNAGNQTGLKKGDLLEVYPAGSPSGTNPIGKIQVSKLFGIDAAVAQIVQGRVQVDAVVKPAPQG